MYDENDITNLKNISKMVTATLKSLAALTPYVLQAMKSNISNSEWFFYSNHICIKV